MKAILLAFVLGLILFIATPAQAVAQCPKGQVKYDLIADSFEYGGTCVPNTYCVYVDTDAEWVWWSERAGCYTIDVCVSTDDGVVWLGPVGYGSYLKTGTYHLVWWGGCQVPGLPPPRSYMPLVVKGR